MSVIHFNSKGQTSRKMGREEIERIKRRKEETRKREERARKTLSENQRSEKQ